MQHHLEGTVVAVSGGLALTFLLFTASLQMAEYFLHASFQDLQKITINDIQHIIQAATSTQRNKQEMGFKMYISSYIHNYKSKVTH